MAPDHCCFQVREWILNHRKMYRFVVSLSIPEETYSMEMNLVPQKQGQEQCLLQQQCLSGCWEIEAPAQQPQLFEEFPMQKA